MYGRPAEPCQGDEIRLIGPSGEPNGIVTRVKRVLSEDPDEDLWEVLDKFNQVRFITKTDKEDEWLEVEL